ncbi:MAG: hypothetical protein ABFR05_09755 [Bacteroidota bacterium]
MEKEKFEKWKAEYEIQQEKERYKFLKPIIVTFLLSGVLAIMGYYLYTGEYRFIGQKTIIIEAEIIETNMFHMGKGYYLHNLKYEYEFQNEKFQDYKKMGKKYGRMEKGDLIKIKISTKHPERNKYIGLVN